MPLDEAHKVEVWLAGVTAAAAATWKIITMFFKLRSDVASNKARIEVVESDLHTLCDEMRKDMREVGDKNENRFDRLDNKLDRLIERELNNSQ